MLWVVFLLLPKGNEYYCKIGPMEPSQKVVQILINVRLQEIQLNGCLYGFVAERGTGTAILELNRTQQLAFLKQEVLFVTFLDLKKSYNTLD